MLVLTRVNSVFFPLTKNQKKKLQFTGEIVRSGYFLFLPPFYSLPERASLRVGKYDYVVTHKKSPLWKYKIKSEEKKFYISKSRD